MTAPALLAVAHGSPEPRAEHIFEALLARVRSERAELTAVLAYLGHYSPDVPAAIESIARQGIAEIVVVPLLLSAAYHSKSDLPGLLGTARLEHPGLTLSQAAVLGPHPLLFDVVRRRLAEADVEPGASVVLGAVGTSDPAANAELADVAATLRASIGFVTGSPALGEVVAGLRTQRALQVAVAAYALAPGQLPDRFYDAGADVVTEVIGAAPEVAELVLLRYDAVVDRLAVRYSDSS